MRSDATDMKATYLSSSRNLQLDENGTAVAVDKWYAFGSIVIRG